MTAQRPLSGRTALVTGGSRGIGAAAARSLAAMGAGVIITYRSARDTADELALRLRAEHEVPAHAVPFDLTAPEAAPESASGLIESAARLATGIDILVANAAAPYPHAPLLELPAQQLAAKVGQDVAATHRLVTATAPGMLERGYGRMILIGSLHAKGPSAPGMTANGVTKAALAAYARYAADELTGPGVTINVVHPGYVATETSSHLPPAVPPVLAALTPSGRTAVPDDIAGVITMLTRDEAAFLNGACLPVSGGLNQPVSFRRLQSLN
ncbi:SDR family NAD(P)-dependent oxidoreductase [Streptomyces rimosus]|uniref:SDR family NAD(P)-dependent oxidoreductase n=1 Tax=Streptomyces rimosus TaxID=1927 RepID=UPI0004C74534|nr:SDR family oxidoreductase [Streptomyces rimosus]